MKIKLIYISYLFMMIGFLQSCNQKSDSETTAVPVSEAAHDHEEATVASLSEDQLKAAKVILGAVEMKNLTSSIQSNGELNVPNNSKGNVTALFGGLIQTLNVQIGSQVSKGQVIGSLTNPQYVQMQEEYLSMLSKLEYAEQELARQKELNAGNAGVLRNLQVANAELSSLKARKSSLAKQLQMMGINPSQIRFDHIQNSIRVTSPISGEVSQVFAKIGSYVDVSTAIIEIVDNSALHLDLHLFEKDISKVKIGQRIHFNLTNNPEKLYEAKVYSIGSTFENESKTIAVHANVLGDKTGLIDGMNVVGMLETGEVQTAAVPNDAIVESNGRYYIFIETEKQVEVAAPTEDSTHAHSGESPDAHTHTGVMHNFEKIEVMKGVSALGYTGITPVVELPASARVVIKGAFFINAKLSNTGDHEH